MSLYVFIFVFFASYFITWGFRHYAITKNVLDIPNDRSSHNQPTPRGGGISIVLLMAVALFSEGFQDSSIWFMALGGVFVALIGILDDHVNLDARWRIIVHFLGASLIVFGLDGAPPVILFGTEYEVGWTGSLLVVVGLVWLLNLYNFMDGIDGLASVEAISTLLVATVLLMLVGIEHWVLDLSWLLIVAVMGFLVWNFPPAKIFMGDAGSGFLGVLLGGIALVSAELSPQMFWVWLILLGVFIVDATFTLMRRLVRGDKVYEAHRSHAYQQAARKFGSHLLVVLSVLGINFLWLAPLAYSVVAGLLDGIYGVCIAYLPLIALVSYLGAGRPETQEV